MQNFRSVTKLLSLQMLKTVGVTVVAFGLTVMPFVLSFKPFVNGIAVNCPPTWLAGTKLGPLIFEEVEKCQKSPVWMMLILWGLFVYCGLWLWNLKDDEGGGRKMLLVWAIYCLGLILFPEFFYFKDIYPAHFRSNTMFKLGYQVFMMMAFLSGYVIITGLAKIKTNRWWLLGVVPLVYLAAIYPTFSIKSYFGKIGVKNYKGLNGLAWLGQRYPGDAKTVEWFNLRIANQPVILEANGDSYTDYGRISTFTGLPTVAGWTVHEWLWRGGYGPISARAEEVRGVYEARNASEARQILVKYQVEYVIVGDMERQKYQNINEEAISRLGRLVFQSGMTKVYQVI